jgi:DNA-binding CsgD family transcriptional regulator
LQLTANELTIKEIANKLFISSHTSVSHRKNLMSRWEVKNMAGLVRKGFELGVLTLSE